MFSQFTSLLLHDFSCLKLYIIYTYIYIWLFFPKVTYFVVFEICWDYSLHLFPKGRSSQCKINITSDIQWHPYHQFPAQRASTELSVGRNYFLAFPAQGSRYLGKAAWKNSLFFNLHENGSHWRSPSRPVYILRLTKSLRKAEEHTMVILQFLVAVSTQGGRCETELPLCLTMLNQEIFHKFVQLFFNTFFHFHITLWGLKRKKKKDKSHYILHWKYIPLLVLLFKHRLLISFTYS